MTLNSAKEWWLPSFLPRIVSLSIFFLTLGVLIVFLLYNAKPIYYYWSTFDERYRERKAQFAHKLSISQYQRQTQVATDNELRLLRNNPAYQAWARMTENREKI